MLVLISLLNIPIIQSYYITFCKMFQVVYTNKVMHFFFFLFGTMECAYLDTIRLAGTRQDKHTQTKKITRRQIKFKNGKATERHLTKDQIAKIKGCRMWSFPLNRRGKHSRFFLRHFLILYHIIVCPSIFSL